MRTSYKMTQSILRGRCWNIELVFRGLVLIGHVSESQLSALSPHSLDELTLEVERRLSALLQPELCPFSRLEPIALLLADEPAAEILPLIVSCTPFFLVIESILRTEDEDAVHLVISCLARIFQRADPQLSARLFGLLFKKDLIRRLVCRFRSLRLFPDYLALSCSLAEKLIRMVDDDSFTRAVLWGLGGVSFILWRSRIGIYHLPSYGLCFAQYVCEKHIGHRVS
jgi:hypothetical protein